MHLLALVGAFWTAVLRYRGHCPQRFVLGLAMAAVFAHVGWASLHWDAVRNAPLASMDLATGHCVLFAPLGVLLFTRSPAAFRVLPLAFAVARAGCVAAGCCHGPGGQPTPLYEMGGLVFLHALVRRSADRQVVPVFCAGFGLVRLGVEPWRAVPPLGAPAIAPAWIAAAWVAVGIAIAAASTDHRFARRPAQNLNRYWNPRKPPPTTGVNERSANAPSGSSR
jgi:hypothetical protein